MKKRELKRRRLALGLSQQQLADALGVDGSTVYRWEAGERGISPLLERALRALEIEAGIIKLEPQEEPEEGEF